MKLFFRIFFFFSQLYVFTAGYSQELIFCEKVDKNGNAILKSNSFEIRSDGSFLYLLVKLPEPVGSLKVIYDIYLLDSLGMEKFESSYSRPLDASWTWFKNGFTFYRPGNYNIYVYDEREKLLVSGRLQLLISGRQNPKNQPGKKVK